MIGWVLLQLFRGGFKTRQPIQTRDTDDISGGLALIIVDMSKWRFAQAATGDAFSDGHGSPLSTGPYEQPLATALL